MHAGVNLHLHAIFHIGGFQINLLYDGEWGLNMVKSILKTLSAGVLAVAILSVITFYYSTSGIATYPAGGDGLLS